MERSINLNICGTIDADILYDYSPAEESEGESGYSLGYPGCPAEVVINQIIVNGENIYDILKPSIIELTEEEILNL